MTWTARVSGTANTLLGIAWSGSQFVAVGDFGAIIRSGHIVAITTVSLASGIVDAAYSQTLSVSGGIAPYTWVVIAGTLPNSMQLNISTGEISGNPIPTTAGTSPFTVQVTDSGSRTASKALSVEIAKASQTITFSAPTTGVVGRTGALSASTTSGLGVTNFSSDTISVCSVSGSTVTYRIAGTCRLNASQAGNADYAASQDTAVITVSVAILGAGGGAFTLKDILILLSFLPLIMARRHMRGFYNKSTWEF